MNKQRPRLKIAGSLVLINCMLFGFAVKITQWLQYHRKLRDRLKMLLTVEPFKFAKEVNSFV